MRIRIPISVGELVDKITILRIKRERLEDPDKRATVAHELALLEERMEAALASDAELEALIADLTAVNGELWDVEEVLRRMEAAGTFGGEFIEAARRVYRLNDRRFTLKNRLSEKFGSDIREQKSEIITSADGS